MSESCRKCGASMPSDSRHWTCADCRKQATREKDRRYRARKRAEEAERVGRCLDKREAREIKGERVRLGLRVHQIGVEAEQVQRLGPEVDCDLRARDFAEATQRLARKVRDLEAQLAASERERRRLACELSALVSLRRAEPMAAECYRDARTREALPIRLKNLCRPVE